MIQDEEHPSIEKWQLYCRGRLSLRESSGLSEHLEICSDCGVMATELLAVDHYFGRPVPALFGMEPEQMEHVIAEWRSVFAKSPDVVIAADATGEPLLLRLLSLCVARFRVRVTIDAPLQGVGQGVCAGLLEDWKRIGRTPDILLKSTDDGRWDRVRHEIALVLRSEDPRQREAAVLSACGVPVEARFFDGEPPIEFSPMLDDRGEPTGMWSLPGQWVAWEVLSSLEKQNRDSPMNGDTHFTSTIPETDRVRRALARRGYILRDSRLVSCSSAP